MDHDTRPNIILFFSDELDPEYLGAYGGDIPTPHLDQLASRGIRFEEAYVASSMCTPSRFALLTGKYPGRCIHPDFLKAYPQDQPYVIAWNTFLEGNLPTISSILSENGYFTGMAGKWHTGKLPEHVKLPSFSDGDDPDDPALEEKLRTYQKIVKSEVKRIAGFDYAASVLWGNFDVFEYEPLRYHNFPWITYGAIRFLEETKKHDKPFFLYVATTAVHGPGHADTFNHDLRYTLEGRIEEVEQYALPADSMKKQMEMLLGPDRHQYAGMACLDNHFYQVMKKLRELDLEKNTIVLFMADHNVEPGKATCYEKGLQVPFMMHWPGKFEDLKVSDNLVSSVDLLPTILEAAGVPLPEENVFDGISILPGLENPDLSTRSNIYAESGLARSVNDGRWKYIAFRYPEERIAEMKSGQIEYAPNQLNLERQAHSSIAMEHYPHYFDADQLYDLANDPYEQKNLVNLPENRAKLNEMQQLLQGYLSTFNHIYPLADTAFMWSEDFKPLIEKSLSIGTDYIPWLQRDHGSIIWPPNSE
jgi:arylsulfatase A-like enzyme